MKLSSAPILLSLLLPLLTMASPLAIPDAEPEPNPNPEARTLEARADKVCKLHPDLSKPKEPKSCHAGPATSLPYVRKINPGEQFGIRYKRRGEIVLENPVWSYIPGWNCWISARWTNEGCEGKHAPSSHLIVRGDTG